LKILVQRVSKASIEIDGKESTSIKQGALIFVGFDPKDSFDEIKRLSKKLLNYKIFSDKNGKINLSIIETNSEILLVPQVTLSISTKKGLKPSFSQAANHDEGVILFKEFNDQLLQEYPKVKKGIFGAEMSIGLVNEGPVTFLFDS
jgi:D-tyrosyl-tRNA(Tyr) deacylase|tara:strand:+ start:766 stop:1203 length:438 start_codon:yes stop_codon:yes gene_type:complete